ncbi:MAG: hypothetical protein Q9227_008362 [Pyrenula ochraceoflavens]
MAVKVMHDRGIRKVDGSSEKLGGSLDQDGQGGFLPAWKEELGRLGFDFKICKVPWDEPSPPQTAEQGFTGGFMMQASFLFTICLSFLLQDKRMISVEIGPEGVPLDTLRNEVACKLREILIDLYSTCQEQLKHELFPNGLKNVMTTKCPQAADIVVALPEEGSLVGEVSSRGRSLFQRGNDTTRQD